MTTYEVTIGERVVRVALRGSDSTLFAAVDGGPEREVRLATVNGVLRSLLIGAERFELLASPERGGEVALVLNGIEYRASVVDEAHARLAAVAGAHTTAHAHLALKAPMPGLVVRVLCTVGDEVSASQPLAVLQAMKMENELALPRGGTVASIDVAPGQTVEQGQTLLTVE
jgi:biotin carboxyl carrier protein